MLYIALAAVALFGAGYAAIVYMMWRPWPCCSACGMPLSKCGVEFSCDYCS